MVPGVMFKGGGFGQVQCAHMGSLHGAGFCGISELSYFGHP